jgi:hypothetical protein
MAIGLSLTELRDIFNSKLESGMTMAQGRVEAIEHGENPKLAEEFLKLSLETSGMGNSFKSLSVFLGILSDSILETVDANNKAIEKALAST